MDNIYYTYVYLDTRKPGNYSYDNYSFEYEPFYIGKGKNKRAWSHLNKGCGSVTNKHFKNKIMKIKKETNNNPIILIYNDNLNEESALKLEINMIKSIGRCDIKTGPLCNLTDGGDGGPKLIGDKNPSRKPENRKKISERMSFDNPAKRQDVKDKIKLSRKDKYFGENNTNSKSYEIIFPNGNMVIVKCLKTFCKENNLSYNSILTYFNKPLIYKSTEDGYKLYKKFKIKQYLKTRGE